MTKIAIIGDLHFGVRNGNESFFEFQADYIDHFIDKCVALGVEHIVNPGDFFDVRKSTNTRVVDYVLGRFKKKLESTDITWYATPGNHDIFLRSSNALTACRLFDSNENVVLYEQPTDVMIGGKTFLMMPWLDEQIGPDLEKHIASSRADYCFGHFEFAGFPMYAGSVAPHGLSIEPFKKFKRVWSGHYHTISERQNIQYLGSPYHLTWGDVPDGTNRGFFIFDTDTEQQEFVANEDWMSMFSVFEYDPNAEENVVSLSKQLAGKIVKVIVREKPNEKHYKNFVKALNQVDLIEHRIIDETVVQTQSVSIKEEDLTVNTREAFDSYIDGQEDGLFDKAAVKLLKDDILARALAETP